MPHIFRAPKIQLTLALLLIALSAILHRPQVSTIFVFLLAVGFSVLFDLLFLSLRKIKLFLPYAAIVSGLIIGLLTNPHIAWYQIATICILAMAGKNFLRISGKHIFNPAGTGLFLSGILFHQTVSWWGVSFQAITSSSSMQSLVFFIILLSPLFISAYRVQRYGGIFVFLISYAAFSLVGRALTLDLLVRTVFDPSVIFFSIVMLPEPMTSPIHLKRQVMYGVFIVLIVALLSYSTISSTLSTKGLLPDPLIAALLLGNLIFFRFR